MSGQELTVVDGQATVLTTMESAPAAVVAEAQKAAVALKDVIARKPKPVVIGGEMYLEFEDLQLLGRFYGVTVGVESEPEFVQLGEAAGFKATAVALRGGAVISRATAYCLNDEEKWGGGDRKPPLFQLSSMAQTRACAKALRNVLSWVAVLAGYRPTPAEEMDGVKSTPGPHAAKGPECPKCGPKGKVIASKYAARDGSHPWVCLECKTKWGNADAHGRPASSQDPDATWAPEDEARG